MLWIVLGALAIGLVAAAAYGLHRGALWLEDRGHIYYLHKKPSGGAAGSLIAFQQAIDPSSRHVQEVELHQDREGEDPEGDDPRRLRPPPIMPG